LRSWSPASVSAKKLSTKLDCRAAEAMRRTPAPIAPLSGILSPILLAGEGLHRVWDWGQRHLLSLCISRERHMRNKMFVTCVGAVGPIALLGGCVSQYKKEETQEKQAQQMPVNCTTAEGDIRALQAEKINVAKQIAAGVSMIAPIGLVVGVATKTEGEKYQVTTGDYNKMLDNKIAEIKQTCHIS
jgi:hypothetical protein